MLMNPNWDKTAKKTAKDVSLADFIGWLETKEPTETYDYHDKQGACCMGQYMAERGIKWSYSSDGRKNAYRTTCNKVFSGALDLAGQFVLSGLGRHQTFGDALQRAKKFQKENA